jgi:hypothetical protein
VLYPNPSQCTVSKTREFAVHQILTWDISVYWPRNVSLSVTVTVAEGDSESNFDDRATMRCLWVTGLLVFFFVLMVSCNAPGCYWERTTDSRGLSRHRAVCPFHKRASTLANQRRHTRAKEVVASNFVPSSSARTSEPVTVSP